MTEYKIAGKGTVTVEDYCECKHCRGHDYPKTFDFDYLISADNEDYAIKEAKEWFRIEHGEIDDFEYSVNDLPARPVEVELYLLERWQNGQGLPGEPIAEMVLNSYKLKARKAGLIK